jgi:hypothetical protein
MSLVLIAALIGGILGYLLYKRNPEGTERKTKLGLTIWKLLWIPVYILILYSLIISGDIVGILSAMIITTLIVIFFLVFRPDQDIKQYRNQI